MWLTLENSVELADLLGVSQEKRIEVMEELKRIPMLWIHRVACLSSFLANSTVRNTGHVLIWSLSAATLHSLER